MSAVEVCRIIGDALSESLPGCEVDSIPVADGGEGTLDSLVFACNAKLNTVEVTAPDFGRVNAAFAVMGNTAVVEMAQASGLPLVSGFNDPVRATTYGTGEVILAAMDKGCTDIVLGIGGSATTDGGVGCLSALGVKFLDADGVPVDPNGLGMSKTVSIDMSGIDPRVKDCNFTVLCDVENPLYGKKGAAYVYSPQKGADSETVAFLDEALRNYEKAVLSCVGVDCALSSGSGAAGGMGYGLRAMLGATLKSGARAVFDICGFDSRAKKADVIITGEGKFDSQSFMGKVPCEVVRRAGGKPVAVVCGVSDIEKAPGIAAVFRTNAQHLPFESVLPQCREMLRSAILEDVSVFLKKFEKNS
jgi:glycerate kinase